MDDMKLKNEPGQPESTAAHKRAVRLGMLPTEAESTFEAHPEWVMEINDTDAETIPKGHAVTRTFDTGATRDTGQGKLDYIKALSPIVLRRYVQYLDKHRLQSDGSYRDFDNWKQGIPIEVYRSSGGRHFVDDWLLSEGYTTEDNHGPITDIEDVICAQLFNLQGRLKEILEARFKEEAKVNRDRPVPGGY
ncbi:MAG: hypothetical protein GY938_30710 [Ketobacter sp.]|nr:hypothetical protein [Ketobacter sp.]